MDDLAAELEAALTSGGTLLVWAEKYRYPDPAALPALRTRLLSLGDDARRLARRDGLDQRTTGGLLAAVGAANAELRRLIEARKGDTTYREAVACRTAGDADRLAVLLPDIFADLTAVPQPEAAYWTPTWQRRGRPRPADVVAAEFDGLQTEGIPATGDDLTPGVDPELPGVLLASGMPLGSPLALRYDGHLLPQSSLRLGDDVVLVPSDRLHLPFTVALAAADEPLDEWVADPAAYLDALERACRQRGLAVGR
jgi:hypothetical protein